MRKSVLPALFFCACFAAFAQDVKFYMAESPHYRVYSETSQSQADETSRIMEACLVLYNGVFHFDLSQLPGRLQVKVFRNVDSFNAYLTTLLSQTRDDFVFVAYSDPKKSELVAFTKESSQYIGSLLHQGCIQFMKAFIANPPVWLREGVATYLEEAVYNTRTATLTFRPNYLWLDSLKEILLEPEPTKLIPFTDLSLLTREAAQEQLAVFYPEAWGLVTFLIGSPDNSENRIFWDAISALDPQASLEENSQRVRKRAFSWVSDLTLAGDFRAYVLSLKTARDLLREGVELYGKGELDQAEKAFRLALEQESGSEAACYYLGLIAYVRKDYPKAQDLYQKAATLGLSAGLVNYALGVNALAAGKIPDAVKYLKMSKDAEPAAYGEKSDAILKRIEAMKN
jgi:tetratricopeptide (TPR) repeat protein